MGYQIKAHTDDIATKAGTVARKVSELESELTQLNHEMASLSDSWTGAAAASFQSLYDLWKGQAVTMHKSLGDIGVTLKGAGTRYAEAEAANISATKA